MKSADAEADADDDDDDDSTQYCPHFKRRA